MEHFWNGTDKQKPRYSEKNLSQCHLVHHQFLELNVYLQGDRPLANYLNHGTDIVCYMDYFCFHVTNTVIEQPTGWALEQWNICHLCWSVERVFICILSEHVL